MMDDIADRLGARSRCWDGGDSVPDAQLDADAAFEIRRLRSEVAFLRKTLNSVARLAASSNNYGGSYEPPPKQADPAWAHHEAASRPKVRLLRDPPAGLEAFCGHQMTARAWGVLRQLEWTTAGQVIGGDLREMLRTPNAGWTTAGEIARLRRALIECEGQ